MTRPLSKLSSIAVVGILSLAGLVMSGCTFGREFRDAAGPALQSGVTSILTGLVNGVFAAIEPEPETEAEAGS